LTYESAVFFALQLILRSSRKLLSGEGPERPGPEAEPEVSHGGRFAAGGEAQRGLMQVEKTRMEAVEEVLNMKSSINGPTS
jgi:hypothetical protein